MNREHTDDPQVTQTARTAPTCGDDLGIVTLHPKCILWMFAINVAVFGLGWLLFS